MRFPAGTIREQLGTIREQISCNVLVDHRLNRRNGRLFLPLSTTKRSLPGRAFFKGGVAGIQKSNIVCGRSPYLSNQNNLPSGE
jgi:hypothetical protein